MCLYWVGYLSQHILATTFLSGVQSTVCHVGGIPQVCDLFLFVSVTFSLQDSLVSFRVFSCLCTYRASNEVPSKMSLTTDELKSRAQPLTNTDLEIKQGDDLVFINL